MVAQSRMRYRSIGNIHGIKLYIEPDDDWSVAISFWWVWFFALRGHRSARRTDSCITPHHVSRCRLVRGEVELDPRAAGVEAEQLPGAGRWLPAQIVHDTALCEPRRDTA